MPDQPVWFTRSGAGAVARGVALTPRPGVARSTSSIVVRPSATFIAPARRSGRRPSLQRLLRAASRMSGSGWMRARAASVDGQQLVQPGAAAVAGHAALEAADRLVRPHLAGQAPGLDDLVQRLARRSPRRAACRPGTACAPAAARARRSRWRRSGRAARPGRRSRVIADAASLVCSVLNTRWPVSAAWIAISAVSRSRISPTMMMSGSCRISARRPSAKPRSSAGLHLRLVERRLDHLDRVFDRADVDLVGGQPPAASSTASSSCPSRWGR